MLVFGLTDCTPLGRVRHWALAVRSRSVCVAPSQTKSSGRRLTGKPPVTLNLIPRRKAGRVTACFGKRASSSFSFLPAVISPSPFKVTEE